MEKVRDIVGLYLDQHERSLVLCVDEKSQIQALDRSQLMLPMRPGQVERITHDYMRHGTTTLFDALDIATGKIIGQCLPRHRSREFLKFLSTLESPVPTTSTSIWSWTTTQPTRRQRCDAGWSAIHAGISTSPRPALPCPSHLFHLSQKPWNFASPPDTLSGMHKIIEIFADRAALHTEILALRQQVAVLKRKRPRPSLRKADRVFWVILSCLWPGWRHALVIVRPETVIGWHRKGFRLFWTWKSRRGKPGRPPVSREIRYLVRRMSRENTRWGAPRIHGELLKLGFSISQAAVSKYMVRYPSPPSQSWRTFLTNHADCLASIDFFVVPTATFHLLFGFIVLHHERRQIVHFGVTANPTMAWVAQQIREAFPWGTAPRHLIRDRDGAYGQSFRSTVTAMGVEEVVTAPRSPWQNPYVERLIGSVRRECLDHSIILNERHLRRILGSYFDYYHGSRTHLSLGKDTPDGRPVQPAGSGTVVSLPKVGGLHHRYERLAA